VNAAIAERFGNAYDRLRTYDRPLLIIAAILFAAGILLSMAASPAATARRASGSKRPSISPAARLRTPRLA
jgi:hypothetical protein